MNQCSCGSFSFSDDPEGKLCNECFWRSISETLTLTLIAWKKLDASFQKNGNEVEYNRIYNMVIEQREKILLYLSRLTVKKTSPIVGVG